MATDEVKIVVTAEEVETGRNLRQRFSKVSAGLRGAIEGGVVGTALLTSLPLAGFLGGLFILAETDQINSAQKWFQSLRPAKNIK